MVGPRRADDSGPAVDIRPLVVRHARAGRPARPPAAAAERRPRRRPRPADLARALHLPARARLRRRRRPSAWHRSPSAPSRPRARRPRSLYGAISRPSLDAALPRPPRTTASGRCIGKVMMDRLTLRRDARAGRSSTRPAPVGRPVRALARARRRPAAVRGHAALRRLVHGRTCCASRRTWPHATGAYWQTHLVGGPRRDRRGGASVPRCARLPRRLRPGRRPRAADDPRPRDPPLRPGDRPRSRRRARASRTAPRRTCSSPSGAMPLARYLAGGALGRARARTSPAGPDALDLRRRCAPGPTSQNGALARCAATGRRRAAAAARLAAARRPRWRAGARASRT